MDTGKDSIGTYAEFRAWPDSHAKILAYGAPAAEGFDPTYFVAYLPNGNIVHYGKTVNARVTLRQSTRALKVLP